MNPYFFTAIMVTILDLKRVCPKCKRSQLVPSSMKHNTVRCKLCGTDIRPRQTTR